MMVWLAAVAVLAGPAGDEGAEAAPSIEAMLREFTAAYSGVALTGVAFVVGIDISPPGDSWYVSVSGDSGVDLNQGVHEAPAMIIRMSQETLGHIHRGGMTAFTAAAKASGADTAPVETEFRPPAEQLADPKGTLLGFIQHFFVRSRPERILLGDEYSRVVHGAHAIPLYYATGFRSAWYKIKDGQHLNEPGDTNPYPQAFVIVSGQGRARIGDAEVEVRAGESYYIPPGSDHVLWPVPGEALEVIWLAWGEGA
jgi:mannose-6-phosphate isomerase-like protein (cupin superfamily)